MAHSTQCFLPRFGPQSDGPKRPMSMRTKTSRSETTQLASAWCDGQLDALIQTTWALVLYRYTGSGDICFGYQHPSQSPDHPNICTYRVTISEDVAIRALLEKVIANSAEKCGTLSVNHQDFRLYNTMVMIRNCCDETKISTDTTVQPVAAIPPPYECRIRLHVKVLRDDIGIFMEWWNGDMSTEQMNSMSNYFQQVLTRVLSGDDIPVNKLGGMSESDWSRVCKFNAAVPESYDRCIHEIIHEQALRRPGSEAVCAWDGSLTYSELDVLASQFAYHLQAQGVGPEIRVALCFDKSKWNIVAMLAVLKAGGAFVPLDPAHPATRLQSLAQSVQARIMLCSRNHADDLRTVVEHLIPLDGHTWDELSIPQGEVSLLTETKGCNAAYVIFTSGSTGEPKGTLMEHRAYVSSAIAHAPRLRVFSDSRLLQFAAHTFDASLVEILTTLLVGACICVPSEEARLNDITKVINDMNVNHATLTPSFVDFISISDVPRLETLVLAGEAMSQSHLETWSKINLVNGFGPTETAVTAAVNSKVTKDSDCRDIGLPTGVRCWIVDSEDHNQLVPVGCVGEMLVEGPSLARGYVNNQQKTAEVFIYDPAWSKRNDTGSSFRRRFYKTGDLVRYNSEAGSLTYLGRKDTQVKFHGQRIELGEIEDNLNTDPKIKHCLVSLPKCGFSEGRLAAVLSLSIFDSSNSESAPLRLLEDSKKNSTISQIRDRLSTRLPAYMIPTVWLCVETLPLLVSGKLDRKATASWIGSLESDPNIQRAQLDRTPNEASFRSENTTEEHLASIWSRVLNVPRSHISLDESFLSLGGDSIAGLTCVGFCKKQGIGITVQDVLQSKSIRDLATRAKEIQHPASYEEILEKPFHLSPIQKLHFMVRKEGQGHFNQSVLTRLNQRVDEHELLRSIEILISRHSMLRSRFTDLGAEGLQQRITEDIPGSYHCRVHDVSCQEEIEHIVADSQSCINAFTGPLIAVNMFNLNGRDHVLSLVAHHLVVDIVSWRIILEDLEDLLLNPNEATSQGGSLPFQTWCQLQVDHSEKSNTHRQKALESLPAPDFAYWGMENHTSTYGDVDCETFEVDAESTHTLLMGCHKSLQTEPIDIFLASLLHSFQQTFRDRCLPVIYNEGHGREVWDSAIDISRTVGWFTILHPITLQRIAEDDPVKTLVRVKDLRRRVTDNGRQDFARRLVGDGKERGHHCPMEISFNYVGQHRDLQRQDGLFQLMNQMAGETGQGGGAADFGENTPRFALFEISAMAVQGRLRFTFSFNRYMKHQQAIRNWISRCHDLLKELGPKLQSLAPEPTLSSFPMLSLTYEELETIFTNRLPSIGIDSPDQVDDIYPCSRMQQGILLSRSRDEGLYSVHDTFEVKDSGRKPDLNRLVFAWKQVVMHHPMLRTIFVDKLTGCELFCQVVLKTFDSQPNIVTCKNDDDVLAAFDEQGPMEYIVDRPPHRFSICQTPAGKLFCRLEINHVSMDGSSISIIVRDLQLAYSGKLEEYRRPMFKNFLHYLREQDDSTEYWCSYLSDLRPCNFPMLNDGIPSTKHLRSIRLNVTFYNELLAACEKGGVTLSTAISTAWGLTLRQFCGSSDVCFSYLASLRDLPVEDIESVVGPVITLLPCRMKLPGNALLKDILQQVQIDYMEHLSYRNTSLIDIQHALKLSDASLFNTGVSYRRLPPANAIAKEEVQLVEVGSIYDPAEFPLYVNVEVADDDAHIDLNYWTTAFSDGQAENVASIFLKALENIVYYQDAEVSSIDGLSDRNKQQMATWNGQVPEGVDTSVHAMFNEKVELHPDALAIAAWDGELTYAKLNELSSALAAYLTKFGVSAGVLVPLDFGKSMWQIVSVLAVLKVGGVCVPMDETTSQTSFLDWLADNGAQVALATPARAQRLERTIPYVIPVSWSLFESLPKETVFFSAQPSDDCYVIFTSGSSSSPKPVVLSHQSILARAGAFTSVLDMGPETRMFQFASYTSDMFVHELFGTLMCDGCVCIPSESEEGGLSTSINTLQANFVSVTPTVASFIRPSDVPGVKCLSLFGESLTEKIKSTWSTRVRLHTFYGTAECSSTCIHHTYNEPNGTTKAGLGNGCATWIVDPSNHNILVPVGCTGELVLEGPGVSRRYLHNEEQTTQSFIESPAWSLEFGKRTLVNNDTRPELSRQMFKTGDLAQYNSDGTLVHMGRKDKMIVGGIQEDAQALEQRIDLALLPDNRCVIEVIDWCDEQVTTDCLAVFILLEDRYFMEAGEPCQIIAQSSPQFHALAQKGLTTLLRSMPAFRVPSFYFPVHNIPLKSSGRLDRRALKDAARALPESTRLEFNFKKAKASHSCTNAGTGYWEEYLADVEPCLFPSLSPTAVESVRGVINLRINHGIKMQNACQVFDVTISSLLHVIWGLVLRCYTGLEDVCFGYRVSEAPEILCCRINLKNDVEVEGAVQRRNQELKQGLKHSIPLSEVRKKLGLQERSIFNTAFISERSNVTDIINDVSSLSEYIIVVDAKDLESLERVSFHYSRESLSDTNVSDIVHCFEQVLKSVIHTSLSKLVGDINFLSEQSCKMICEWNSELPERPQKCAHEVIRQQSLSLPPSTPAICSWDANLTYSDVEHLSSRLAQYLIGLGVGPEIFVALFFEKSAWYVIAQVAVLKAGGAFVSLDPSHPETRLQGLVDDIGAHVMLCSAKHCDKASRLCDTAFVVCEATIDRLTVPSTVMVASTLNINNAAYAIFTSGTTGKPKVSVIEHMGLGIAAATFPKTFRMDAGARVLQFSNYIFDVNVLETIITLMTGGCICIPSEDERMNDLAGAINRMAANTACLTPSTASALNPESIPTLRTIMMGGEKMTMSHVDRWADRCVINAYGPSEATVASTASIKAEGGRRLTDDYNSIGTAFAGRAWIVDPHNYHRLVPIGAVGELVLEGCNVGRGYLNNAEKTKEVFITDPQWTEHEGLQDILRRKERMYRTGDLVRYNSDGTLCFISRKDTQIKLNGQRIELEEIEQQCIGYLPTDTQVAVEVVTPEARTVAKGLAVFFTILDNAPRQSNGADLLLPMDEATVDIVKKLHSSLKESLPIFMIPKLFFPVRYLPFAATGKLDRKGLRAMIEPLPKEKLKQYTTTYNAGSRQASERGAEDKLRDLWEEALGLAPDSVNPDDSFFGIGGDSLSAMKLVSAAHSHGITLTVADIYANPVLADMATICEPSRNEAHQVTIEPFSLLPASVSRKEVLQEVADQCCVSEASISDIYPCSSVQEGLITLSIKQQGAYIARPIFKLTSKVNLERFKAAWQRTADELDILRTRIVHMDSMGFLQVVLDKEPISWTIATMIDEIMDDTPQFPTHNGGLLTGYAIVQPGNSPTRYFIWTAHHALYDGWSVPLILKRVEELYNDSSNKGSTLPYKLFISHLQEKDLSDSDKFWKSQLADISCSPFPQSKASLSDAVRVGNRHYSSIEIKRVPESKDLTLPELIRAAWAIVISVYTGSDDVCFGETLMGRNIDLHGVTEVAGPVLTTVPTRIQVDNGMLVTQFLQNIRKLTTAMIPHQHAGLQRIRKLDDNTSLACDFQNLLVIQTEEGSMNGDLWIPENNQTSGDFFTHPLTVECKISESKLGLTVHHDEIVLDSWQTERLTNQFTHVIQQLLTFTNKDTRKLSDLEVTSPQDKQEISLWNQRPLTRVDRCVHDIIREREAMQPEAPAICAWDGQLSYREMYGHASLFAAYLNSRGVGPETLVPICLDKSVWAIVTILSVLIAGGAFVPLDPAHPTSRHQEILEEIEARVILCSPQYRNRYAGSVKTIVPVSQDTIRAYSALARKTASSNLATPSNMAYAIFTSGSTGRPKGIIIEHHALASSAASFSPIVHLNENARAFQFASLTFDAAVMEVLATLMHGGCICIPSEDERLNDVAGAIRRMEVSWAFLTPSIASIIEPSSVPSLKVLACGGEKLSREVVQKWAHHVKLINGYGPTETTIFAVLNDVKPSTDPACIGYGIPSTLTWVVDPENHNRLSPLGAIGELALEGAALAREYLKSPEKTADAFVSEPTWIRDFSSALPSPRRIYKTGDLVRYNPDGSIEYISRKDHQVKIHGLRMELGEIEHRLCDDRRVRHAVVILPKSGLIQKRLVAILSLESLISGNGLHSDGACELICQSQMDAAYRELQEIQKGLELQLPIYMVPQTWVVIRKLPMLVSGKLDRKRITAWVEKIDEETYDRIMQDYDNIKRGTAEHKNEDDNGSISILRDIFTQVLNVPSSKIDPSRSFVSLGGDSITGMAVISRARKHGLNLTLHNILQSKSITELALTSVATVQTVQHEEKLGELFNLSPIQGLYIQMADEFQGKARFNQSMTVRLTKRTRPDVVKAAIKAVVDRHSMFRARFSKSSDGSWKQKITKSLDSSYRFRIHSINNPRDMLPTIAESQQCLDMQNGPIFAADLFEVRDNEQVLFIVAHHLCVDMVSWRIVLQDMQEFIERGTLSSDKLLSFQSWCDLQVENSKRENSIVKFPFSVEPPNSAYWGMANTPNLYGHVKMESFTLNEEATAFILGPCHEALRTETVEILLATVIHSFGHVFTDRSIPTIYNEGHGRETWDSSIDISRTVGWFTTMCPLHVNEGSDFFQTLKRVKDTRRKIAGNSRPYFAQSLLHPTGDGPSSFPVPLEVVFNYLGQLQQLERQDSLFQHYGGAFDAETFELAGDMGPKTPRFALFEISAIIIKDKLHVSFTYNRNMRHGSRIQDWISECRRTLEKDVISLENFPSEPTLSDFPLLPTTYGGLDDLIKNTLPRLGIESWDRVEDIYPCSPVQEGILLSQLRDPNGYIFHGIFEVLPLQDRRIDSALLRKAWAMVVNRHPALRTLFIESNYKGGTFDQLVIKVSGDDVLEFKCDESLAFVKLDQVKLQNINASRRTKLPQQMTICTTPSGRVLMKIEMNHAIVDGGSIDVLFRDLALAYNSQLPAGPGPRYSDYIMFTRSQVHDKALEHWKQYLSGVRPCHLSFPANPSCDRQLGSHLISFNRLPELQKFCESNSVTLANLTLSAWAIVLRSFTGSDDICFGYPSAGRDSPVPGIHDAVGIFINMVCCRVKFTAAQTLEDVSKLVQSDYIGNLPHQNCSLAQIQHELGQHGQSLFNTTLSIQNRSAPKDSRDKTISFEMQSAYDPTEYPVTVNVETTKGREGIMLRYWTDTVSDSQAKDLADAVAQIFTCFIESPSKLVSELKLAPGQEVSAISKSPVTDLDVLNSDALRTLIDIRVNEVIDQMLKEGKLAIPAVHELHLGASNGSFRTRRIPRERDPSDSTLTLTNHSRASTDSSESTDLEKRLWTLWSSALGLSPSVVNRRGSFFKLGGDSITAMKMVGAAREEGLTLSVAEIFNNPVFEDMLATVVAKDTTTALEAQVQVTQLSEKVAESPVIVTRAVTTEEISVLRPVQIDDSSFQSSICSKIGVFRGGIADVLPVTDFQALSITASLFKSRWMVNYFFLDGKGSLDIRRLRESFMRVVDAFDILRTVFVSFHGQFFQVVLRKMKPEIIVHETEKSLDEYTESLQQRDREQDPRQGEQYVQFYVVKKKDTDHHRILIRMSHTQFDGVCLPRIMSAIKMGYEGSPIPPTASFSNYMRMLPGSITPEHYQYWATLLQGSTMTDIIRRQTPNTFQHIGSFTAQKKTIEISATVIGDVTLATVMQSAWAMTLAKLSAQSDVVFGLTISGRNATIPGIESTVGPCLNMIPVRVKFGHRWTGLDLFRYLQDQQVANMPYESLGFREIIRNCTDWPDSTFYTTSVFHQNVEYEGHMQLDDNMYRMGGVGVVDNFTDITVVSKPTGDGKLDITLAYSQRSAIGTAFAAKILDMLCETAHSLITNPQITLPSPSTLRSLPCQVIDDLPRPTEEHFLNSNLNSRSISELLVHSDILNKTWQEVLPNKDPDTPRPPFQLNSSFFGLGGDIFSMGQLAWCLEQEGLQVRLEELLEHPTFLGHLAVLALHNAKQGGLVERTRTVEEILRTPSVRSRPKSGIRNPLGKAATLAKRLTMRWSRA